MAGTGILICGMHRSGTSALGGALNACGGVLRDDMPPSQLNPKGYFEKIEVVSLHEECFEAFGLTGLSLGNLPENWEESEAAKRTQALIACLVAREFAQDELWAVKDPRLCRLVSLWNRALPQPLCAALIIRHPAEVCASLQLIYGQPSVRGLLLWLRYVLESERNTREIRRTLVRYDQLIESPVLVMARMQEELGLCWPNPAEVRLKRLSSWIDAKLKRNTATKLGFLNLQDERLLDLCLKVYDLLQPDLLLSNQIHLDQIWQDLSLTDESFEYAVAKGSHGDSRGQRLTIVLPPLDAFNGLALGANWYHSGWFGNYNTEAFPWINHAEHGFLYVLPAQKGILYAYDLILGWLCTSRKLYPNIYSTEKNAWLYYQKGTARPRWFYNYNIEDWQAVGPTMTN